MSHFFAPRRTVIAAGTTDGQVVSENNTFVYGVVASNTSGGGTVLLEEGDGSTEIVTLEVLAGDTIVMDLPFLADNGLNVTTDANTKATIFHSQPGG